MSDAIIEGATVKDVIKFALKPTVVAVLSATVEEVASNLIQIRKNYAAEPPPKLPIEVP